MSKTITFVTGNANKLLEVQRMLASSGCQFNITSKDLDLPELQGLPNDVAENKCKHAAALVKGPVLVEDTSLCFNALNGLPGVYVKWFLDLTHREGLAKMLAGYEDKSAYAQCIFALSAGPNHPVHLFIGQTAGKVVDPRFPPNEKPFGWDPIFEPDEGHGRTFAEMSKDEKNAISHRGRALAKVLAFFPTWTEIDEPDDKKQKTV